MKKIDSAFLEEVQNYVSHLLDNELSRDCMFHTKTHTINVLDNAGTIAAYEGLDEDSARILKIAALFHDTGYINSYDYHEEESVLIASRFLREKGIDEEIITQVSNAIMATRMPQKPDDEISRILCDADLMNMTFDDYFEQIDLMRQEWEKTGKARMSGYDAWVNSLKFFSEHQFHTGYGKEILHPKKELTELKIRARLNTQ